MPLLWLTIGLMVGILGGYLIGAYCARSGYADLCKLNARLYWTLRALMEAAESQDAMRIQAMLKTAWDVIKGDQ